MSGGFDFRDMLGGASATVGTSEPELAIDAIGRALFMPIIEQAKRHQCSPADVLVSAMTQVAIIYAKADREAEAQRMLRHIATVAAGIERTIGELKQ